jgi:hypothetical protein
MIRNQKEEPEAQRHDQRFNGKRQDGDDVAM